MPIKLLSRKDEFPGKPKTATPLQRTLKTGADVIGAQLAGGVDPLGQPSASVTGVQQALGRGEESERYDQERIERAYQNYLTETGRQERAVLTETGRETRHQERLKADEEEPEVVDKYVEYYKDPAGYTYGVTAEGESVKLAGEEKKEGLKPYQEQQVAQKRQTSIDNARDTGINDVQAQLGTQGAFGVGGEKAKDTIMRIVFIASQKHDMSDEETQTMLDEMDVAIFGRTRAQLSELEQTEEVF